MMFRWLHRLFGLSLLVLLIAMVVIRQNSPNHGTDVPQHDTLPHYVDETLAPQWLDDASDAPTIGDFAFVNQHGDLLTRADLDGRVSVVSFFFTSCGGVCPRVVKNLKAVDEKYSDVALVSYSVMPDHDTVEILAAYALDHDITSANWHLLTGDREAIYTLARESYYAGVANATTGTDDIPHTENVMLVDGSHRIRGVYSGTLAFDIERLVDDINVLKKEHLSPEPPEADSAPQPDATGDPETSGRSTT
jgi:protein SCO1/2